MKKSDLLLIVCIVFFAFAGLVLRNFPFSQGNLDKDMPPVITSYDVFANSEHIKWIYDSEQAYYYSPARTGGIDGVISTHPTLYYVFIATFTKLTLLSPYQTAYLLVNVLSMIIILQIFILVKRLFGVEPALIGLAFGAIANYKWLFPMYVGFQYDYFTFAVMPVIIYFFILIFETSMTFYQKGLVYFLFGLFFTEQFLGHYVELVFYAPFFLILPLLFVFWKKSLSFKEYVSAFLIILLVISPFLFYFLPLTLKDHLRGGFGTVVSQINSEVSKHVDYFPWPRFDFWMNVFSVVGIGVLLINFRKQLSAGRVVYLLFLGYLLFVGFSNYTFNVWANRAERQLFQGYPFLVLLPAIGITAIFKTVTQILKLSRFDVFITLVLLCIITFQNYGLSYDAMYSIDRSSFVDDSKWGAVAWVRDNTSKTSRVFALSGFEHEFSLFTERVNLKGDLNRGYTIDNIRALCMGKYPENYFGEWAFREYGKYGLDTYFRKRVGVNKFEGVVEPFQNEAEGYVFRGPDRGNQSVPLVFFDYVILQYMGTSFDPCMGFFLNESINNGHQVVWYNDEMAVVKINKEIGKTGKMNKFEAAKK